MSRPARFDTPTPRKLTRALILQHGQPAAQAMPADGVPGVGEADVCRAARARVHGLGPVRGHAFCQLGRAHARRESCGGLASGEGQRSPRGITTSARSTLAYAHAQRPWPTLLGRVHRAVGPRPALGAGAEAGPVSPHASAWTRRGSLWAPRASLGPRSGGPRGRSSAVCGWITRALGPAWGSSPRASAPTWASPACGPLTTPEMCVVTRPRTMPSGQSSRGGRSATLRGCA